MAASTDIKQRVKEATVAVLDTHPRIVAITGRAKNNIVPFGALSTAILPVLAYLIVVGRGVGGLGDTRNMSVQITAAADDPRAVSDLIEVIEDVYDAPAFGALPIPLKAYVPPGGFVRQEMSIDAQDEYAREDAIVTLIVQK